MAGRLVQTFNEGGFVVLNLSQGAPGLFTIVPGTTITFPLLVKRRILDVRSTAGGMWACQISSETVSVSAGAASDEACWAVVSWQSGRGTHLATVDVTKATSFTLSAAEAVSVDVVLGGSVAGSVRNVYATAGPATAANPIPARLTVSPDSLVAGVESTIIPLPTFARSVQVVSAVANMSTGIEVRFYSNTAGGVRTVTEFGGPGVNIPIPPNAQAWALFHATVSGQAHPIWDLLL